MTRLEKGQLVRIIGGLDANGKIGQVSDLDDSTFVGVRIPDIKQATETVYVTRGSVTALKAGDQS